MIQKAKIAFSKPLSPMLAVLGVMPDDPEKYAFEFKWDGYRAICYWDGKKLQFRTRNQLDITEECFSLVETKPRLGAQPMILDGEVVAADEKGHADFALLQEHFGFRKRARTRYAQLTYMIFDILYFKENWTVDFDLRSRRALLEKLPLKNTFWKISPCEIGEGDRMLGVAKKHELEGLIAKRLDSSYQLGRRSGDWIKIKFIHAEEFVIGGWRDGEGEVAGGIGSVLLGYYKRAGDSRLTYVGNVGTGFTQKDRIDLKKFLFKHKQKENPFTEPVPKGAFFSKPLLVAQIEFRTWTQDQKLRQGAFKGLRIDKKPKEVRREAKGNAP